LQQCWKFDATGNWKNFTQFDPADATKTLDQQRQHNRLNQITGISRTVGSAWATPTFDRNGNMLTDEKGQQYKYDAWSGLVETKDNEDTVIAEYQYDGQGWRIGETHGDEMKDLYYSRQWQVLEEQVESTATNRYVWSPVYADAIVLRDRDTDNNGTLDERLWVVQDANWNVTALVDGSGNVVERYAYDPYGSQNVYNASWSNLSSSAYAMSYGFQGLFFDSAAGLNATHYRWYSPTIGRWVTMDPMGYTAGDINLYRFASNSPISRRDPTGLKDAPSVAIDTKCGDTCGPDVTEWFLKDLRSHAADLRLALKVYSDDQDKMIVYFAEVAKYYLSYKWMDFSKEGCGTGKGAHTVMFAGVCIRKNQLGNIAFGYISNITGLGNDLTTIRMGYIPGSTYDKTHPHRANFGKYVGMQRADNLAAFSLGAAIRAIPDGEGMATDKLAQLVASGMVKNGADMYSKYADLYEKGAKLTIDNLTFIPEYGGFDTRSLKPCMKDGKPVVYTGPGSKAAFFATTPGKARVSGVAQYEVDARLRLYYENYWGPSVPK
jgi:RHS repeat-associated protein